MKHLGSELSLVRSQHAELERQVQEANVAQRQVGRGAPSVTPARRIDEHRVDRSRAESSGVQSRRAATRVFAESEEVDGKGVPRNSTPAPPLALLLLFMKNSFRPPVPQPLSTTSMILSTASTTSSSASRINWKRMSSRQLSSWSAYWTSQRPMAMLETSCTHSLPLCPRLNQSSSSYHFMSCRRRAFECSVTTFFARR